MTRLDPSIAAKLDTCRRENAAARRHFARLNKAIANIHEAACGITDEVQAMGKSFDARPLRRCGGETSLSSICQ
jgi:hypothetical protein